MKRKLLALLMGTTLALAACGGNDNASKEVTETGDAEKLYSQNCAQCHGQNLEGGVGTELAKIGSKLSQDEIEKIIADGVGAMPENLLKGDDAKTVAEWLAGKK